MPDDPAGQDVAVHAQVLGDDILAKLDALTQQPAPVETAPAGVTLEERKVFAREAISRMDAIVADYLAKVKTHQATTAEKEIERIKASLGA